MSINDGPKRLRLGSPRQAREYLDSFPPGTWTVKKGRMGSLEEPLHAWETYLHNGVAVLEIENGVVYRIDWRSSSSGKESR